MEYQQYKFAQTKRRKVMLLSFIAAIFFHIVIFFAFRIKFVPYEKVAAPKIMRIRRVRIPPGRRPGPLSASAARKKAKPKPIKNRSIKKKKRTRRTPKVKSKLKVASTKKKKEDASDEIALMQEESEFDVLSMIEGEQLIPGGGNLGNDEDAYGVLYGDDMMYEYENEDDGEEFAENIGTEEYLGAVVTPVVQSEPYTTIEENFSDIPYPDLVKIKRANLQAGVCRVYLRLSIDPDGEIQEIFIRSPKTESDKQRYKIFLDTVINTVQDWRFERKRAIVFVDVRFTIE